MKQLKLLIARRGGRLKLITVFAIAISTLSACSTSSSRVPAKSSPHVASLATVNVIYQPSGLSSYFYATAKNVWAKYGLKLHPISIEAGQDELAPLVAGSADFAFLGGPPTITAIGKKVPVTVIFSTNDVSTLEGLIVPKNSPIKNLNDIVGKTIAVPTGSSAWAGMHLSLAKAGIPFSSVKTVNLSPSATLSAFEAGSIQGAWIWDTWIERMESLGGRLITVENNYGVAEPNSWVVSDSFLKDHENLVKKFIEVLNASAIGVNHNPAIAAPEYSQLTGVTTSEAIKIMDTEPTFDCSTALNSGGPLSFVNTATGFADTLYRSGVVLADGGIIASAPGVREIQDSIDVDVVRAACKS